MKNKISKFKKIKTIYRMYDLVPSDWEVRQFSKFAVEIKERFSEDIEADVLSVTKHNGFVKSEDYFKKQIFSKNLEKYKLVKKDDFAYATIHLEEGSLGLLREFEHGYISPMYTVFRTDSTINKEYLYLLFKSKKYLDKFKALGEGTVRRRKSVKFKNLSNLMISLPALPEQDFILEILSNIEKLQDISNDIFLKTTKIKQRLLSDIFPNQILNNSYEKVNLGGRIDVSILPSWTTTTLGELSNNNTKNGYAISKDDYGDGVPIVGMTDLFANGILEPEHIKEVTLPDDVINRFSLNSQDLLFGRRSLSFEGAGKCVFVPEIKSKIIFESSVIKMTIDKDTIYPKFVYHFFNSSLGNRVMTRIKSRVAVSGITSTDLKKLCIPVPKCKENAKDIVKEIDKIESDLLVKRNILAQLKNLKEGLMQKLLTGQVRVTV